MTVLFESLEQVLLPLNSARQLAELSGIGESTLAEWRGQHTGPSYVKIGRRVLYPKEAVLDYLRTHTQHTTSLPADE
ncbi:helix-turn-helix transcriptional regulator [Bifidobacterium longum]|uniref:helix-turn-helix transcriptional regulator n=1 Tax=Bifidobacterium longum TaxID=216816 RepID=UPI0018AC5B2B|nr:helix-turn-helix domain-containing protein [Bifidobacterium longum]MDB6881045.1 helix-turn-helix domain-containing protein [Bifidobacterium longum]MDB6887921.1 helix-turn-helix domain-containing protein [Bifidobacterium longum]MDB6891272.1 helix-turn-helix domain-containing protein [Bifidobacterium longum]